MQSFWHTLEKPILALAPLADVTDPAFRRIIAKYSKQKREGYTNYPFVMWTEFISADGLCSEGREVLKKDLMFTEQEYPIVAQLFTSSPENMRQAAAMVQDMGFDGVDINMGCPDKAIEKQGCGSDLIKHPKLAQELIRAAQKGAPDLPISVKTRTGYNQDQIDEWIPALLEMDIAVLTVHARTRKEMSNVPARWEDIARVVRIRDDMQKDTLIFGNGDLEDVEDAHAKVRESGADGAMLGRAIFGNPWLFTNYEPDLKEKLEVLVEHSKLFCELLPHKSFAVMKKHYKAYVNGFDGAKELRTALMEASDVDEVERIAQSYIRDSL